MIDRLIVSEVDLSAPRPAELNRRLELARLLKEARPNRAYLDARFLCCIADVLMALWQQLQPGRAKEHPAM
jgi:hypothetical protein